MLKLDPKNTELLAQKQTVLKQNIEQTTEKLKQLKNAQDLYIKSGGDLNSAEYRNLQREITNTENKLKQLNLEASKWTQASQNLSELSSKMTSFGNTVTNVGKKVSVLSTAIGALYATGVKNNIEMEKNIKIFELFTESSEKAKEAVEALKKDAQTSIFSSSDLIEANRFLLSAGLSAEEAREDINNLANAIAAAGGDASQLTNMAYNLSQVRGNSKAAAIDMRQFANTGIPIWQLLTDYTGKSREELEKMGVTYEILTGALKQAANEGGRLEGAMESLANTTSGKFTKLKGQFQEVLTSLTESLLPTVNNILEKILSWIEKFNNLSPETKDRITKIGLAIVALGPALVILGKLITYGGTIVGGISKIAGLIGKVSAGVGGLSNVLSVLTGPVGIVIAIVGALIATFVHLYNTNEEFRSKVQETWKNIVEVFQEKVMPVINQIKEHITNVIETIWNVLQEIWGVIEPFIQEIFEDIMDWWNESGEDMLGDLMNFLGELLKAVDFIWKNVISPIIKFLTEILKPIVGAVFGAISGVIKTILDVVSNVWNGIKGIFEGIINFITGVFTGDWEKAWEGVKQIFKNIVSTLASIFKAPINIIVSTINGFIKGLNKIKLPDWVPGLGGKGINIPLIPQLAKGGIVNSATLAMIGEGKSAEAVIPLDKTLTKYMAEAMKQAGGTGNITVNFYPQQMTEAEMDRAFNYLDRRFGMAY